MTEKNLDQASVDALFRAARGRGRGKTVAPVAAQAYSFSRAGQISGGQIRAISLLNDVFARNLTRNLGAWLRSDLRVSLVSAEQLPFSDFLVRVPKLAYVCSVRLEPLRVVSVLEMDLDPAPAMIDLLLGGSGSAGEVRELTDVEESILTSVAETICRELSTAWQQVGLSFHFEQRLLQAQIARVMPVAEKSLCLSFRIAMPQVSGLLNLAFPAVVSNTVLHRLTGDWMRTRQHAEETRKRMIENAGRAMVGAALQLPSVRVPASDIESIKPGGLLRLRLPSHTPAELRVSGVPLFSALPVSTGAFRGAHLGRRLEHFRN